jgi:TldD protein
VPLAEKRRLVEHLNAEMLRFDRRIVDTWTAYRDEVTEYWLVTAEGTAIFEVRPDVTLAVAAVARQGGVLERAVESVGGRAGFGLMHAQDELVRGAARRAVSLLEAAPVRSSTVPVVLDPRLAGMLAHVTVGHLAEADAQDADPLVATLGQPGRRLGSTVLTIGDDGSARGLRGTLPFDDEGTPAGNTLLMQHGVMVGRLHTRETAARYGERATGNARALSWRHAPGARLTNPYIQNGTGTFQDLLRDIKLGVYACDLVGSMRQGVSAALHTAHGIMIRDGELAELVKGVVLAGDIADLLGAVDRVAGDFRWHDSGGGCDRHGHAALPTSDGAPHIRLRSADVRGRAS